MEGVGARLGRSSTRYGPTTVFTGPVRKWKKKWIHVSPPSSNHNHHHHSQTSNNNGTTSTNGNNGSQLLLYKWTPITQSQNTNGNTNNINHLHTKEDDDDDDDTTATDEPPRRKFKYIPIAVLEEQNNEEGGEQVEDEEAKPCETELDDAAEPASKSDDAFDEKPDINDTPMEESQESKDNVVARQDLNELDLSLGLKSHDDDDSDSRTEDAKDGEELERVNSGT